MNNVEYIYWKVRVWLAYGHTVNVNIVTVTIK